MKSLTPKLTLLSLFTTRMGMMSCQGGPPTRERHLLDAHRAPHSLCSHRATGAVRPVPQMGTSHRLEQVPPRLGRLKAEAIASSPTSYRSPPCAAISTVARVGKASGALTLRSRTHQCPKVSLSGQRCTRFKRRAMRYTWRFLRLSQLY